MWLLSLWCGISTLPEASCPRCRQDKKGKGQKGVLAKLPFISLNRGYPGTSDNIREAGKKWFLETGCIAALHKIWVLLVRKKKSCAGHKNIIHIILGTFVFFHSWLTLEAQLKLCHFLQAALMNKTDATSARLHMMIHKIYRKYYPNPFFNVVCINNYINI